MREILRLIVVLAAFCVASASSVALVKEGTKERIAYQKIKFIKEPAIKAVLSGYDNDPVLDRKEIAVGEKVVTIYPAKKGGELITIAYETEGEGHGGPIEIMLGVNMDGTICGVSIMKHAETPGLGSKVKDEPQFCAQFKGMSTDADFSLEDEGGDVQGISGATESSTAVAEGMGKGMELFEELKDKIAG